jgi:hypothetical protein
LKLGREEISLKVENLVLSVHDPGHDMNWRSFGLPLEQFNGLKGMK